MADPGLTGVLLVGGASRRFGSPKALARLDGETLAERAWRTLGEACDERLAVGKTADGLGLPFPLVDDGTELRAPLAGLVAGLRAARFDVCVVVPVDVPLVTAAALRRLGEACADAAVPQTGPLPGAYRKRSALPVLERRLAAGELALRDALAELETAVVEIDPELLVNVNTPSDLEAVDAGRPREATSSLLRRLCSELVDALSSDACLISRVIGELLIEVTECTRGGATLELGHGYLVPDFPLTQRVIERREPATVDAGDQNADSAEVALLLALGFTSLLMLPLESAGEEECWGLVEIYRLEGPAFCAEDIAAATPIVSRTGSLLRARSS